MPEIMTEEEYLALASGFTSDEVDRINQIAAGVAEDITIEDAELYANWKAANARIDEYYSARNAALKEETQIKLEQATQTADLARDNLQSLYNAAMERLRQVENANILV